MARRLAFVAMATLCLACWAHAEGTHGNLRRDVLTKHARILRGGGIVGSHSDAGGVPPLVNRKLASVDEQVASKPLYNAVTGSAIVTLPDGTDSGTIFGGGTNDVFTTTAGGTDITKDALGPFTTTVDGTGVTSITKDALGPITITNDGTGPTLIVSPEDGALSITDGTTTAGGIDPITLTKASLANCPTNPDMLLKMPRCDQCRTLPATSLCYQDGKGCRICGPDAGVGLGI